MNEQNAVIEKPVSATNESNDNSNIEINKYNGIDRYINTDTSDDDIDTGLKVQKRDGRIVDFDNDNIISAIMRAFKDINHEVTAEDVNEIENIANRIEGKVKENYSDRPVEINEIQNLVEHSLLDAHMYDVANAYKDYRWKKDVQRAKQTDANEAVKKFLRKDKTIMNENANKDSDVYATQRDLLAGAISKASFYQVAPKDVVNAHMKGDIHFHDADYSLSKMTNCSLPNFRDMLNHGFRLGNADMGSAKSIGVASTQITQIIQAVASSQYGGQTVNRMDEVLAPFAMKDYRKNYEQAKLVLNDNIDIEQAKSIVDSMKSAENKNLHIEGRPVIKDVPFDEETTEIGKLRSLYAKILTRKNIYDAMQTLEYQTNTTYSSSTGQTPFITVGFGLGTGWAEREITRCLLYVRIGGLGERHLTAIFPKLTYTIKHGVNSEPSDPNYDLKQLALECTSKRMYPDILFYENIVKITGSFKAPMGCRSFLQGWINPETGKDEEEGRMNLGVVTVNLPRIAIEAKGNIKRFWRIFNSRVEIAHHALQYRIQRTRTASPMNAPVLWEYGAFGRLKSNDSVNELMKNSRATVSLGYIGLYETTAAFFGADWVNNYGWDEDARQFALSILKKMTALCAQWEKEEGYHYSVYGTPAESLTDRFNKLDREKFGRIPAITDKDFYTNSFHRPVWLSGCPDGEPSESIKEVMKRPNFHVANNGGAASKLDFESVFLPYTSGGHIVYVEYPSMRQNLKGLEAMWDYAHEIGIDYLGSNTPIDHCDKCGYYGDCDPTETGYECPVCHNTDRDTLAITKRLCGYLGEPSRRGIIHGRYEEMRSRAKEMQGETGRINSTTAQVFYKDLSKDPHKNN